MKGGRFLYLQRKRNCWDSMITHKYSQDVWKRGKCYYLFLNWMDAVCIPRRELINFKFIDLILLYCIIIRMNEQACFRFDRFFHFNYHWSIEKLGIFLKQLVNFWFLWLSHSNCLLSIKNQGIFSNSVFQIIIKA